MTMTVIVTSNVPARFRGFLASCALEIGPGVYTLPEASKGVRERIWAVLEEWYGDSYGEGSVLMTWTDKSLPGRQGLRMLGQPRREFVESCGLVLTRRELGRQSLEQK